MNTTMDRLTNVIKSERADINLFDDVLKTMWANRASEEGADDLMIVNFLSILIHKTSKSPSENQ